MQLIEQKFSHERGNSAETYQSFTATLEMYGKRRYLTVDIGHLSRWRSKQEIADYLRWCADELMKLPIDGE